jgi:hypothetical protein
MQHNRTPFSDRQSPVTGTVLLPRLVGIGCTRKSVVQDKLDRLLIRYHHTEVCKQAAWCKLKVADFCVRLQNLV